MFGNWKEAVAKVKAEYVKDMIDNDKLFDGKIKKLNAKIEGYGAWHKNDINDLQIIMRKRMDVVDEIELSQKILKEKMEKLENGGSDSKGGRKRKTKRRKRKTKRRKRRKRKTKRRQVRKRRKKKT
tara:strand:+ start:417 stop:794 length:378 start_codon:yes stop_codon:yes gene_type:complete